MVYLPKIFDRKVNTLLNEDDDGLNDQTERGNRYLFLLLLEDRTIRREIRFFVNWEQDCSSLVGRINFNWRHATADDNCTNSDARARKFGPRLCRALINAPTLLELVDRFEILPPSKRLDRLAGTWKAGHGKFHSSRK